MTTKLFIFSCCILIYLISATTSIPILSCNQTPNAQVCTTDLMETKDQFSEFRTLLLKSTMKKLALTHQQASLMSTLSSLDERTKTAWNDCLFLLDDSINLLNDTISSSSYDDSQTWLSAAKANIETCKDGFIKFDDHHHILTNSPFMALNLSESLSNALTINKAALETKSYASTANDDYNTNQKMLSDGYPSWLSMDEFEVLDSNGVKADVVVAKDGSAKYKTISEALKASTRLRKGDSRFVIHVKAGRYNEKVEITKEMKNLMLVGDGKDKTIITASKNEFDGSSIITSATVGVDADGFVARQMTIENAAGARGGRAVAFRVNSDMAVIYQCSIKGYQDTLLAQTRRQFYRECDIYGTIDFIFGDAAAVFQNCNIYLRNPSPGNVLAIAAQGRSDPHDNTGFSIMNSKIVVEKGLGNAKAYLGRPWKEYSRTVYMKTSIHSAIHPSGWLPMRENFALNTLYFGEYMNTGPGAGSKKTRVQWKGYRVLSADEAAKFTVNSFLKGGSWIAKAGVPYSPGL